MSWALHHSKSQELASEAESALRTGDEQTARSFYGLAAEQETLALACLHQGKKRTAGITAVSAASLWFKADNLKEAERVAYKWLATDTLPIFAATQLQIILQTIWNERQYRQAGIEFIKGEVLVSLGGGEIVTGGAPLDLIHRKVDEIRGLYYRTIEWLMRCPFRRHGGPSAYIQEQFRPWLLQAPPGSYQFAVRIQKPAQLRMFGEQTPRVEEVTQKFLQIVSATAQKNNDELENMVSDSDYRQSFLKITRNMAPSGKSFGWLEIKSSTGMDVQPITLSPESRQLINKSLKKSRKSREKPELREEQLKGVLRALHLDKDWIEIGQYEASPETIRIYEAGDIIDDLVGPMVNHKVIVDVAIQSDGRHLFRDIQPDD